MKTRRLPQFSWCVASFACAFFLGRGLPNAKIFSQNAAASAAEAKPDTNWVCPMHPHVQSGQSGKCPVCGMDLVRKQLPKVPPPETPLPAGSGQPGVLTQNLGVRLTTASRRVLAQEITTYGTAATPGSGALTITPKVEGWVRRLYVSSIGQKVAAKQPLYDFYSPELIQKQREYIDLLNRKDTLAAQIREVSGQNAQVLAALARDRVTMRSTLLAADIDSETLEYVERSRRPAEIVTVRAPGASLVTALPVAAGAYVTPMTPVLSLASAAAIWVDVLLYPDQASWIRGGEAATVRSGNYMAAGTLTLPNAFVDPVSKVLHGRVELPFTRAIHPGSAVTVAVSCRPRRALAIAAAAVIRRAQRDYAMRWEGNGQFRPVELSVGMRSRDFVEVRGGLAEGEQAAAAGEFLLEAESSLDRNPAGPPL